MTDTKVAVHIDITNNAQRHECSNLFFRRKKQRYAVLEIAGDKLNYHAAADYRQSAC